MSYKKQVPRMTVGKYAGTPIDALPNSYLRWMMGQKFPKEWLEIAKRKLEASDWNDDYLHVTRHAIDMFSKRFLDNWLAVCKLRIEAGMDAEGLATYVTKFADAAWKEGKDVSKNRHQDDGITKLYSGIKWVFKVNHDFPDYREVITVMPVSE